MQVHSCCAHDTRPATQAGVRRPALAVGARSPEPVCRAAAKTARTSTAGRRMWREVEGPLWCGAVPAGRPSFRLVAGAWLWPLAAGHHIHIIVRLGREDFGRFRYVALEVSGPARLHPPNGICDMSCGYVCLSRSQSQRLNWMDAEQLIAPAT